MIDDKYGHYHIKPRVIPWQKMLALLIPGLVMAITVIVLSLAGDWYWLDAVLLGIGSFLSWLGLMLLFSWAGLINL